MKVPPTGARTGRKVLLGVLSRGYEIASGGRPAKGILVRWARHQVNQTDSSPVRVTGVSCVGHSTYELRVDSAVIAFIQRRDRTFVARAGPRAGKSRDCPQCLLWVEAARELVHAAGSAPPRSTDTASNSGFNDGISCRGARILAVLTANVASRLISIPTP